MGRAASVLGSETLLMLYNALVLPHLQYCLIAWGDFKEGGNKLLGDTLLRHQKKLARLIEGGKWRHADPILGQRGILKIGDLYRQQLRIHAWKFRNDRLPGNQAEMLGRTEDVHSHNTRAARAGLYISTRDHRAVGYRIPKEWDTLSHELRTTKSLTTLKRKSKEGFLTEYRGFTCGVAGCFVCNEGGNREERNAVH